MKTVTLAMRDWGWLTPLVLGEIDPGPLRAQGVQLAIERVQTLPGPGERDRFDVAETSLSRHVIDTVSGSVDAVGVPYFAMQAFRSRCVLVREDTPAQSAADLDNGRLGLTGWHDSGNIWTRDALRHDGLDTTGVRWFAGPLSAGGPIYDRLGPGRARDDVSDTGGSTLVELLLAGVLDGVLTPFMPPAVYGTDAPLRPLYPASTEPELRYYAARGYVPGIHLLTADPALPGGVTAAVVQVLDASRQEWLRRRARMLDDPALGADTAYQLQARHLRPGWDSPGIQVHRRMIEDFLDLQVADGIIPTAPSLHDLFMDITDLEESA
ncbi:hypothetical protein GCM10011509_05940 [Ornithinimicrobium pekingense]|uniref:4,5-dihydroxyphthalate decarboxylase n=1 Tax=Ornithinimicrobium pekingense TaxID=384677 RepID=A0ABQ2F477_9MICO|nr:hypothetical protein GCM10011509_05940 [Ornithinimicrobium pekingense]